jgi:serine/threonine protein phosphatase PrpC
MNEDALACQATAEPDGKAVLVVCDGVTRSSNSEVASLAAARTACSILFDSNPQGIGVAASQISAIRSLLSSAVQSANQAVVDNTDPTSQNPASTTFVAAVVLDSMIYYANVGDSRAYWLADDGETLLLTCDHSLAQAGIEEGFSREEAENAPGAHTITRWLGRDSMNTTPSLGQLPVSQPGWLLVCSDGLWNNASAPEAMRSVFDHQRQLNEQPTDQPAELAQRLVDWANSTGGHDNITVCLARLTSTKDSGEEVHDMGADLTMHINQHTQDDATVPTEVDHHNS